MLQSAEYGSFYRQWVGAARPVVLLYCTLVLNGRLPVPFPEMTVSLDLETGEGIASPDPGAPSRCSPTQADQWEAAPRFFSLCRTGPLCWFLPPASHVSRVQRASLPRSSQGSRADRRAAAAEASDDSAKVSEDERRRGRARWRSSSVVTR